MTEDSQKPQPVVRIARPSRDLAATSHFYQALIGLERLGGFEQHNGYDGCFLGFVCATWHLELTFHKDHQPTPSVEDLLVFYLDQTALDDVVARASTLGLVAVLHPNPYWEASGAVGFVDPDGYFLILCPED